MQIKEENNRFALYNDENQEIGEMTWSDAGESMMIIDHTFVDPTYRGQKLAEKLVLAVLKKREKSIKKLFRYVHLPKKNLILNLNTETY